MGKSTVTDDGQPPVMNVWDFADHLGETIDRLRVPGPIARPQIVTQMPRQLSRPEFTNPEHTDAPSEEIRIARKAVATTLRAEGQEVLARYVEAGRMDDEPGDMAAARMAVRLMTSQLSKGGE